MIEGLIRIGLGLLRVVAWLPRPVVKVFGALLGEMTWLLAAPRRRIALANVAACFPTLSATEHRALARRHFRAFMTAFAECFVFWFAAPAKIRARCELRGLEHLEAAERSGRPVIVLAPHFVGLDAGGIRLQLERPLAGMYAHQKSAAFEAVMTRGRARFNSTRMLARNSGLRPLVKLMREGYVLHFSPDMDLGPREAVFVPFFGVPAATVVSLARLARLTRAQIVPLVTHMTPAGYVAQFFPAWSDYPGEDDVEAALRMNQFIEARVLEAPEQYLWTHKRFKTRPPGLSSLYGVDGR
jgi:KDO2-lipid IV(A) lauroyltransferase